MIVVGPLIVLRGSDARCVHSMMDRSVVGVHDAATIPTFPAASTPTVANDGFTLAPPIFAVCATTHAFGFEQSRSTQNARLPASTPWEPQSLAHGPEVSAPCR